MHSLIFSFYLLDSLPAIYVRSKIRPLLKIMRSRNLRPVVNQIFVEFTRSGKFIEE